jgi:hypothetical protein
MTSGWSGQIRELPHFENGYGTWDTAFTLLFPARREEKQAEETAMIGKRDGEIVKTTQELESHIPTPYGCMSLVALILGTFGALGLSLLALVIAIFRARLIV